MPIFETAEERSNFIKENASYFNIVAWQRGSGTYKDYDKAKLEAKRVANEQDKTVMIYAVWHPNNLDLVALSTWVENVAPERK